MKKLHTLLPAIAIAVVLCLPGCAVTVGPIETTEETSNPAAADYCYRNPESVLCRTV